MIDMRVKDYIAKSGSPSLHILSRMVSSPLSDELRAKNKIRCIRVKKGDRVKIMRGDYKDIEGKVNKVNLKTGYVTVEGLTREKVKGENIPVKVHSSKVQVISLELGDKLRAKKVNKSG